MTFTEFTSTMLEIALTLVLPALVIFLRTEVGDFVTSYIEKVESEKLKEYLEYANLAVDNAVADVTQTFVDGLKVDGKFDENAMQMAFEMAKQKAMDTLSVEAQLAINTVYKDFGKWLDSAIESAVKHQKDVSK